ncbi:TraR/DksA family transcriptional regulator [Celeribacter indicus]|uniref:TraR/DksA family transcriptional regulator n=1 Tax=Celeribacter indicus TaxID=1208324 RepID=A0A0B5E2Y6_9RHOB|nr:TraR/DksA family transcriptional regulator [Celeribacter indicus]AJE47725.1 TraR/DksA family transcriptional regulator [Celeribacter indicus]SDW15320.1 transcriptional regulator, TraR/DksA family [Celeribacter indicus]
MMDLEKRRSQLVARRVELAARLREIDAELDAHQSKDWSELATEREADEVLEVMGASGQAELELIAAALRRIDSGEYGYCAVCGEGISEKRLDVLPYTPLCKECAAARG